MKQDMATSRTEGLVVIDDTDWYLIPRIDRLDPFLVAVVSPGDHWMYASSTGGLAAGRVDAEGSLFPYRTDDLLHRVHGFSGGFTAIRVDGSHGPIWEPFTGRPNEDIERNLARSVAGDRLLVEEVNRAVGLRATVRWTFSDESGIVRRLEIERLDDASEPRSIDVMDGIRELVAGGASVAVMQSMSCLVNAYTRAEMVGHGLAVVAMESALSDRAEPAESLIATTIWGTGLSGASINLDAAAADAFLLGRDHPAEPCVVGRPAAYLRRGTITLPARGRVSWSTVADTRRSPREIVALRERLASESDLDAALEREAEETARAMDRISADTDGLQCSGDPIVDAHHRTNTLYNDMRGGIPHADARVPWGDFVEFCRSRHREVADRHASWLESREAGIEVDADGILAEAAGRDDVDLERITLEYLPFWFGRRHGDPSRPWNRFSIRIRDEDGGRVLFYEGNWRDIFQNWEALALAHPSWLDRFIAKFVNATTPDGFNAYRLTREGIDWEVPEPDNPWSNLGYWGDHQIVYLTRLLEASRAADPDRLTHWLDRPIFSFADVPYRLAGHDRLVEDPRRSIDFDHAAHAATESRTADLGADGRLVHDERGVVHATLSEKLLIPVLAKLGAFVPDGGVWMNTQRPEWNDANNALAGWGLSMVTACQLRRHLKNIRALHDGRSDDLRYGAATAAWLSSTLAVLTDERSLLGTPTIDDTDRRRVMDALSRAFEMRRGTRLGRPDTPVAPASIVELCDVAMAWLDHAIVANRREDGLYHGYNLLQLDTGTACIRRLPEMLEGQVAVLSAGLLAPSDAADVLDAIFASSLHRDDLGSFLLQPGREIPALLDKGVIPSETVARIPLITSLVEAGDRRLVERDETGVVRFATGFVNGRDVAATLDEIATESDRRDAVEADRAAILDAYESIFDHHAFTGRSGGMYGYEGIGCTYWHMVAKLLVAVGECVLQSEAEDADGSVRSRLAAHYHRVRDGLGFRMTAERFGALPIDAYSHSNGDGQARQPGMTGQVKEELLTRRMELGVRIEDGIFRFAPTLVPEHEWTTAPRSWTLPETDTIEIPRDGLGFQCCGVPIVYHRTDGGPRIAVHDRGGGSTTIDGDRLDAASSRRLLRRDDAISRIEVAVPKS